MAEQRDDGALGNGTLQLQGTRIVDTWAEMIDRDTGMVPPRPDFSALVPTSQARSRVHRAAFAAAAVRLADAEPGSDDARHWAHDAAEALIRLSELIDEDALREILRPDPVAGKVTWTVACYQIGDLAPSALRDFPDPVAAVSMLASCPERSHVAAELLASNDQGVRWPALVRCGTAVAFQLFSLTSAVAGDEAHLALALERWERRLARWAVRPDELVTPVAPPELLTPPTGGASAGFRFAAGRAAPTDRVMGADGTGETAAAGEAQATTAREAQATTDGRPAGDGGTATDTHRAGEAPAGGRGARQPTPPADRPSLEVGIVLGQLLEAVRNVEQRVGALAPGPGRFVEQFGAIDARLERLERLLGAAREIPARSRVAPPPRPEPAADPELPTLREQLAPIVQEARAVARIQIRRAVTRAARAVERALQPAPRVPCADGWHTRR